MELDIVDVNLNARSNNNYKIFTVIYISLFIFSQEFRSILGGELFIINPIAIICVALLIINNMTVKLLINLDKLFGVMLVYMISASTYEPQLSTILNTSQKMWPLPAGDLFMVGRATKEKLSKLNINTIGDIAKADVNLLMQKMHSHGKLIYEYANGIDNSEIRKCNYLDIKGIGNSITISYDVETYEEACRILLALTESATMRLRENRSLCSLVVVSVKTNNFLYYSHQKSLENSTDSTNIIYEGIKKAFREAWKGEKIRQLGVRLTKLCSNEYYQESLFDFENNEKQMKLDKTVDEIRKRFGKEAVIRSTFLHSGIKPIEGGTGSKGDYPMMSSIL
ncbi:DinB/UmuC family translesion DNA polymerase [Clostridium butyricum]